MVQNLVNKFGKMAGWNSIRLNIFGRDVEAFHELSYDDNVEHEAVLGQGNMPIGIGEGNYQANFSVGFYKEEINAILRSIPPGKRLSDAQAQDVIVQYEYDGEIVTDIIHNFKITGLGRETKQGDKTVTQTVTVFATHITWNAR